MVVQAVLRPAPSVEESIDEDPLLLRHRTPSILNQSPDNKEGHSTLHRSHEVPVVLQQRKKEKKNEDDEDNGGGESDEDDDSDPGNCWRYAQKRITSAIKGHSLFTKIIGQYKLGYQQYDRKKFLHDSLAGITVAIMAIPLSMSYGE